MIDVQFIEESLYYLQYFYEKKRIGVIIVKKKNHKFNLIKNRELAEWLKAVSLRLIRLKKSHPFKSDILCIIA